MGTIVTFRKKSRFVSIPIAEARYCRSCDAINNSPTEYCTACGSSDLAKVKLPSPPPDDPGPGPAPAMCAVPNYSFELLNRAA
ncbi:hypothetical protein GCM10011585_33850 [Edaphobacter dinghuensis]|uniref:Uncharacterized protein n=1 Tax=Edaphobacter dinghuensis TaxID=1560005 RepID=A0A917HRE6_9BACT|nr:hypothetical protein GCM10011585_33850 [Edaphobacter dinghuensis]